MAVSIGQKFGPYEILAPVSAGGMGEVWKAVDTRLRRIVAIKYPKHAYSARFKIEARAIAALNHPNICQLYDVGDDFLVMEYVEGASPAGPLPEREVWDIASAVASALAEAHAHGIVHRDLKPQNIRITPKGTVKLLDFGLAKHVASPAGGDDETLTEIAGGLTQSGVVLGTVAYMSPEQAQGRPCDSRSDIFSLGIVLYELLSGCRPFQGDTPLSTLAAIMNDAVAPLGSAPRLDSIVQRCLAKSPAARYQSAADLVAALRFTPPVPPEASPSIAVLPFTNMSADKENEYFGDGLADDIINALAHLPGLKVAARTSSFYFRGGHVDCGEIGRRLRVGHILEGSVRKAGGRIRVTAQLIAAADGFHVWSERFDRDLTDIFAIQDEITSSIAGVLRLKLAERIRPRQRHVPNLDAYDAFLRARDHYFKGAPESIFRLREYLERAIQLDPQFALAHSLLGLHYTGLAFRRMRPLSELIPVVRETEHAALQLDPDLQQAHAVMAVSYDMQHAWNDAEPHWRNATARLPVSRDVSFWYANHHLLLVGRIAEAVEIERKVLLDDPLNTLYRGLYALALRHAGRLQEAEAEVQSILTIDENAFALSQYSAALAQQGRFHDAREVAERAHPTMAGFAPFTGMMAALLVKTGSADEGQRLITPLMTGDGSGAALALAIFHAICGDLARAAEHGERAVQEKDPNLIWYLRPFLHGTRQWTQLATQMNLPQTV